jgi:hypothetical protein
MPEWVFGGDYGDISNMLNDRDNKFEILRNNELVNDAGQIKLDKQKRVNEYEKSIQGIPSDPTSPLSLGEMYRLQIAQANKTGNPDIARELEGKLADMEREQRKQEITEFTNAANLADTISPDVLATKYPKFPKSEAQRIYNERRKKSEGEREGASVVAIDPSTGRKSRIPWSQAEAAQDMGLILAPSPNQEYDIEMRLKSAQTKQEGKSSGFSPIPWGVKQDRFPGQSSGARPSVGDQVEQIKLKRKVQ